MLIELAVGDSFGANFEFMERDFIDRHNNLSGYYSMNCDGIGRYTDDTQMSIAMVDAMFSDEKWTRELLARKFLEAYKRDPRSGYARRFGQFLNDVKDETEFLEKMDPQSDRSGAAMRATPLGLIKDVDKALRMCALQASITHNTIDGINAALASTAMTHYFAYDVGPKVELGNYLDTKVPALETWMQWSVPYVGKVGLKGWMSVRAAITAIQESNCLSELLLRCVDFSGDVDTVATIALAAGSFSKELTQDLPQNLIDSLENDKFGRDYLYAMDLKLMALKGEEQSEKWL